MRMFLYLQSIWIFNIATMEKATRITQALYCPPHIVSHNLNHRLNDNYLRHKLWVSRNVISQCNLNRNETAISYGGATCHDLIQRRSRNISRGRMCVFRTLTCLHRTDSGPRRDTLRAISTVCFTLAWFGSPRFCVFSVNPLLHRRLSKRRVNTAVTHSKLFVCPACCDLHII